REKRASSPQPSPPEEERERISQTRSKEKRKLKDSHFVFHPLVAVSIMVYGATDLARADGNPAPARPAQTKSQLTASRAQPGLVNDWLRGQSSSFTAWDFGGQFRARYAHPEYLGPVDFSASGGHSS